MFNRTMRVTGTGKLSVKPDTIHLNLTLTGVHEDYSQAVRHSDQAVKDLKEALEKEAFDPGDLKTASFSVDSKYEGYQEPSGQYRQRFIGFEYDLRLFLEMEADKERLGLLLTAILKSGVPVHFSLAYTLKDPQVAQKELLARAVRDAQDKAACLAQAAGVKLGLLVRMDDSIEETTFRREIMRSAGPVGQAAYAAMDADLEPADLQLSERVRMVYEIA